MKILFVTYHGLGFGGAEVSTKYLAEGLKRRGREIVFASHGSYDGFKNYHLAAYKNIPLFFIHNLYMRRKLRKIIKTEKPDLIHVHDRLTSVPVVQIANKKKIPVIVHFRDYWFACPRSSCVAPDGFQYDKCSFGIILKHYPFYRWVWEMYKMIHARMARRILNKADLKFANSESIKRRLEISGIDNAEVLPILRDLEQFSIGVKKGVIRKKFGLKDKVVTYVGGFTQVKGISFLLEVIADLLRDKKDWDFLIAGHGPLESNLRKFVEERNLEQVKIVGKIDIKEMPFVYQDSDIILLPSLWDEPLSGILLEAGASGKCVIASDKGGNKDVIVNGKNGFIVPAEDKKAWKETLLRVMESESLRKRVGEQARKVIQERFALDKVARIVEERYRGLIH